jgi:hypothetical protein
LKNDTIITVLASLLLATTANAGQWPNTGDQFRQSNGTIFVVVKVKERPTVDHSLVCLRKKDTSGSCAWTAMGDLRGKGDWIVYEGEERTPQ